MLYSNAPIIEATIDLCVELPERFEFGLLESFQSELGEDFPYRQDISVDEFAVQPQQSIYTRKLIGYRFLSANLRKIVQARSNGMSYTALAPYEGWEAFALEARTFWDKYRQHLKPTSVSRLGVRYINRLDVPMQTVELKDYLATFPEIARGMPQILNSYFMQLALPMETFQATAVINQAIVPPPVIGTTSIMLDIDLFRDQNTPQDENSIWQAFELLRDGKNQIFNLCLTEKAKGLIV